MKRFWNIKRNATGAELFLYSEISDTTWYGDEVTPTKFQKELSEVGEVDEIDVFINSPGGDVFAGFAIYNILKRYPAKKVVTVDGLAASAASIIAMAGDEIYIPENATLMIHNAWTCARGGAEDLRKAADELDRVNAQIVSVYTEANRTGKESAEIAEMMNAETWMTGSEAVEMGFADDLLPAKQIAACADLEKFAYKHPEIADKWAETQPPTDIETDLEEQIKKFKKIRMKFLEV